MDEKDKRIKQLEKTVELLGKINHDFIVVNQAAWIEWKNGGGMKKALQWIENGLMFPGLLPDPEHPNYKNAQFYYNSEKSDKFPDCPCGNPSSILWMGKGYCCDEHLEMHREKLEHDAKIETDKILKRTMNGEAP